MLNLNEDNIKKNLKVISLVKSNPLMYECPYKNERGIWKQIDETCGFEESGARNRWIYLYDSFCKLLIKVARSKAQGNRGASVQLNEWFYFEHMKFMLPYAINSMSEIQSEAIRKEIIEIEDFGMENGDQDSGLLNKEINNETHSKSSKHFGTLNGTTIKVNHTGGTSDINQNSNTDKVSAEVKIGDKVCEVRKSVAKWLEKHKDDFTQTCSTDAKGTPPDKPKLACQEKLSTDELNNAKPSPSKHFGLSNGTAINVNSNTDKVSAELKVGGKVCEVNKNIPVELEKHIEDFTAKKRKIEWTQRCSTSATTKATKEALPDKPKSTCEEKLPPEKMNNEKPSTSSKHFGTLNGTPLKVIHATSTSNTNLYGYTVKVPAELKEKMNNYKLSTSSEHFGTIIKVNHASGISNTNININIDKALAELRVDDTLNKVEVSIPEGLDKHKDFTPKKRRIECIQRCSTSTTTKATKGTMPGKSKSTGQVKLSPEKMNNVKPSTPKYFSTTLKVYHTSDTSNTYLNSNTDKVAANLKVGDKVEMRVTGGLKKHKEDFTATNRKIDETCSTSTPTETTKGVMTDKPKSTSYELLSPEDQSLKAFFDSMLRTTQSLPKCHQSRIKARLVLALQYQGIQVEEIQ